MKKLLFVLMIFIPTICNAYNKWRVDSNGTSEYFSTDQEKNDYVIKVKTASNTVTVVDISPSPSVIVTSTVCRTNEDFQAVNNGSNQVVESVINKEISRLLILKEMKNYGINKDNEIADVQGRINWLVSIWSKK